MTSPGPMCWPNQSGMVESNNSHCSVIHWLHGKTLLFGEETTPLFYNQRVLSIASPNKGLEISEEHNQAFFPSPPPALCFGSSFIFNPTFLPSHTHTSSKQSNHSNDLSAKAIGLAQAPSALLWLTKESPFSLSWSIHLHPTPSEARILLLVFALDFYLILLFEKIEITHESNTKSQRFLHLSHGQLQPWSSSGCSHFQLLELILWNAHSHISQNISFLVLAVLVIIYWFPALGDEFFQLLLVSPLLHCLYLPNTVIYDHFCYFIHYSLLTFYNCKHS